MNFSEYLIVFNNFLTRDIGVGFLELGFWDVVGGYYVNTPVKNLLINFLIMLFLKTL